MTDDGLLEALANTIATTREAERELFGGLDAATLERPIRPDDWNPRDFQAHLTAWKARQAERYLATREGRDLDPPLESEEEDALNEELRATRADWTWAAVAREADEVADRLVSEIRRADPQALMASNRLIPGTFGNGVLHALTHFRWLLEAGVPLDRGRVDAFAEQARRDIDVPQIPDKTKALGAYDLACYHALMSSTDTARSLLREAFRLDPALVEFSRTDPDLVSLREELGDLAIA